MKKYKVMLFRKLAELDPVIRVMIVINVTIVFGFVNAIVMRLIGDLFCVNWHVASFYNVMYSFLSGISVIANCVIFGYYLNEQIERES